MFTHIRIVILSFHSGFMNLVPFQAVNNTCHLTQLAKVLNVAFLFLYLSRHPCLALENYRFASLRYKMSRYIIE